jgi:hypothetical protein
VADSMNRMVDIPAVKGVVPENPPHTQHPHPSTIRLPPRESRTDGSVFFESRGSPNSFDDHTKHVWQRPR